MGGPPKIGVPEDGWIGGSLGSHDNKNLHSNFKMPSF